MSTIVLCTKTQCVECEKFKPEWQQFLYDIQPYVKETWCPQIEQIIYNPDSPNAISQRERVMKHVKSPKDGYPLLLFYVNGKRWKPDWFRDRRFRKASVTLFNVLLIYSMLNCFQSIPKGLRDKIQ